LNKKELGKSNVNIIDSEAEPAANVLEDKKNRNCQTSSISEKTLKCSMVLTHSKPQ
jgi:hypothetical protein